MPLFMPDEELAQLSSDAASVAVKADEHIRKLYAELESVRAKADAAAITAEQTCSLLEQKYLLLSQEFSSVESQNAQIQSSNDERLAELAQSQAQKHQLHLQSIEKDGEIERLTMEISELHKSKRQLLELLDQKDNELSEKSSSINSYLDKIVNLTDRCAGKEARFAEVEAELARSQATCSRLTQEKELIERHNVWLNEELAAKVDSYTELRRRHTDLEAEMSAKLVDAERKLNDCSSSLNWHKDRLREIEAKVTSLQEELCSSKDTAAATEEQYSAELSTANKLVDLYKESAGEWSRKAGELEGVVKALEAHLSQVEKDYKEIHEKEGSIMKELEKEVRELKQKLEKSEAEIEKSRKANELNLLPFSSFSRESLVDSSDTSCTVEESRTTVPKVPAGVSGTALAASLLRDGWSLAKMYEKYQEAVDAMHHEQLGRREAESILQRVLCELEEKAGVIQDERAEYERIVEAYSLLNQKLQDSISEQSNLEKTILELKVEVKRHERENTLAHKDISDLQKQVTVLLKECRDIQLRCGAVHDDTDDSMLSDIELNVESDADNVISENLLTFRDINGLVEQNVKLRNLVRSLSEQIESGEMELKMKFEADLKKRSDEAASRVAVVLERAEEQERMIESLHASVAMYKRLFEEEQKLRSSYSRNADAPPVAENGRRNEILLLLEDSQEATRKAQEKVTERVRCLEEDLAKARSDTISLRFERDKLAMEANFSREKLEGVIKEAERQREEINGVLARNVEFSQLIVDYQGKLRESSESLNAAEEHSRKLSMEVSVLKHEKEMLSNAERRACDEVRNLSERVYRLQASLDTIQSTEEVREEARAAERRKQEEYIKRIEREWADARKELQEERNNSRTFTSGRDQTLNNAIKQVEEMGKELANALQAISAAESRAAVAEARLSDLEKKFRHSDTKVLGVDSGNDTAPVSSNEIVADLQQQMEKLKEEAEAKNNHMLQYKNIAHVNEVALKQMESAHENFKLEAEKLQKSLEGELLFLRERVSELEKECIRKSEAVASEYAGKEEALASALNEVMALKEENLVKNSQVEAMEIQISVLKSDLEREHERWRVAQGNYERQVILQSETIQELTKTSQALASLQEEASELRKLADSCGRENAELKANWQSEKSLLEEQKHLAEKKYDELNEQNKVLHNRLEAILIHSADKDRSAGGSFAGTGVDSLGDSSLQSVVSYLRRSKEIAETEISLLKQEKLRLQSQLETALKTAETAQASLSAERAGLRASLLTEEEIKSLQLQVREINLLRESNSQLREENKYNFEECQKLREVAQKARMDSEKLENLLRQRQIELESCKKEIELQRTEKDLQEKRVTELLERYKNIDVADYHRLKDSVRQVEEKLKEKDAQLDDIKKLLSGKQEALSQFEKELANTKQELSARESGLNEAQQEQARLKAESDRLKKFSAVLKRTRDALSKEKEELIQEKETLSKQLEEMKQSKGSRADASGDQIMKDKEEKEHKLQILENIVEKQRDELKKREDEMKKKDEKLIKEKADRVSDQRTIKDSLSKVHMEKTKITNELEKLDKYQSAVSRLSEELNRLKHTEGNLPEGTSVVQILSRTVSDDRASAFMSAVEYFENVAHSIATDIRGGNAHTGTVSDVPMVSSTSASLKSTTLASPNLTSPVPAPTTTSQPTKSVEDKEKGSTLSKPKARVNRRIVRPQLVKPEEQPQADIEMSEAEGTSNIPSHDAESQGIVPLSTPSQSLRKRLATSTSSSASDLHQDASVQGNMSTDIIPPAQKKPKGNDSQFECHEAQSAAASHVENVTTLPTVPDEKLNATAVLPQVPSEDAFCVDADKEETEIETEATEEPTETRQLEDESGLQVEANEAMEENLDQPSETEAGVDEEGSRDLTDKDGQELLVDLESEREEGELDLDAAAENEETGEDPAAPATATPTGSPSRSDATTRSTMELEDGETAPDALNEEGYEDDEVTAEGSDKFNDGSEQPVVDADPSLETAPINTTNIISAPITTTLTTNTIPTTAATATTAATPQTTTATTATTATIAATAPSTATAAITTATTVGPTVATATTRSAVPTTTTITATTVGPTTRATTRSSVPTATTTTTAASSGEETNPGDGTGEREETKLASSPLSGSSTIVNLSERARQRSALRQAGAEAGARAPSPQGGRGRGRGRVRGVARGRIGRGGREPSPGQ